MKWGVAVLFPFALSACGDGDRDTPGSSPIVIVSSDATADADRGGDADNGRLKGDFLEHYAQGDQAVPREPTADDVPPLDPTAAPIDF